MNDGIIKYRVVLDRTSAEKSISDLNKKSKDLSKSFASAGKGLTLGLTLPIAGFITNGVKYRKEIEQLETSFEVMTGSADEARKVIDKLKKLGAKTPYELAGLAKTTQTLMQYGMTAEQAYDATVNLGDISQGSADKMQSIALAYGQMSSAGKVNMQDIKQMINAGFNPLQAIADKTGKSMKQVTAEYEAGTISVKDITEAMKSASEVGGRYYQSSEKQAQTLEGRLSTLKDTFNEASGELVENLLPAIIGLTKGLTNLFSWFTGLNDIQKSVILGLLGIVAVAGPLLLILGKLIANVKYFKLALAFLQANPIVLGITAAIIAIMLLIKHFDKVKAAAKILGSAFYNIFKGIANVVRSVFNSMLSNISNFIKFALTPLNALIWGLNKIPGVNIAPVKFNMPKIPALATGTNNVQRDGLAYLHQGEAVVPKKYNPAMGGSQAIVIEMGDVIMDGKSVGRMMTPYITKTIKVGGGNV